MDAKRVYRLSLWGTSVFGVLCFILANSLTPASQSAEESRSVLDILLSFFPFLTHHAVRKLAHLAEYALLGAHFALAPLVLPSSYAYLVAFVSCVPIALLDEGIQRFVPGRGASLWDVLIDCVGYLLALLFIFALLLLYSKRKDKRDV